MGCEHKWSDPKQYKNLDEYNKAFPHYHVKCEKCGLNHLSFERVTHGKFVKTTVEETKREVLEMILKYIVKKRKLLLTEIRLREKPIEEKDSVAVFGLAYVVDAKWRTKFKECLDAIRNHKYRLEFASGEVNKNVGNSK